MDTQNHQIAIVHGTASPLDEITDLTFSNHAEYAFQHGYLLQEIEFDIDTGSRLLSLYTFLKNHLEIRRIFWIASDAVFTNKDLSLTQHLPDGKIVLPYDLFGPSGDCLWIENSQEVRRLLWAASRVGAWVFEGHHPGTENFKEQMGLRYLSLHPPYNELFSYVDQRLMKSYLNQYYSDGRPDDGFGQWEPGDFILHLANIPAEIQISILETYLNPINV